LRDSIRQALGVLGLALPNSEDLPAQAPEFAVVSPVARGIASTFGHPVSGVTNWRGSPALTGVHVPETAVHVNDLAKPGQNDIGRSRQISAMQSEAISKMMHQPPHD
jgi:hypothetical protein